jgi:hypothetical protein
MRKSFSAVPATTALLHCTVANLVEYHPKIMMKLFLSKNQFLSQNNRLAYFGCYLEKAWFDIQKKLVDDNKKYHIYIFICDGDQIFLRKAS